MLIEINVYIWQMRYFINFDKSRIALCIFFISYNWYTKYGMQLRNFEYFVLNDTINIWLHNCENLKINDYYSTMYNLECDEVRKKIVNWCVRIKCEIHVHGGFYCIGKNNENKPLNRPK